MRPIPFRSRQLAIGSRIRQGSKVVGSELIRQVFTSDGCVHGRSSATNTPYPKPPAPISGGPNLRGDVDKLKAENPSAQPPVDLVTTSGGGLDPHSTPEAAYFQVPRVAKARRLPGDRVRQLVNGLTLGEARVNVLALNPALDRRAAK